MSDDPQTQQPPEPQSPTSLSDALDKAPSVGQMPGTQPEADSSFVGKIKSYWNRMNDVLDTSALDPIRGYIDKADENGAQIVQNEINAAHPFRAALAQAYFGSLKDINNLLFSSTTPKNVALMALNGPEAPVIKTLATGANLYFAGKGAQALFEGQRNNETLADYMQRSLEAQAQVVGAGAGAAASGVDAANALHKTIQTNLGLSGDLAQKVADKVAQTEQVRAVGKGEIDSTQQIAAGIDKNIAEQGLPLRMGDVMKQATQVVQAEQARVEGLFDKLSEKATTPVTSSSDMRAEILNTLQAHGIQENEIPGKIFNALPDVPKSTTVRALTANEEKATRMVPSMLKQGLGPDDVRSALVNLGYVPKQVDAIMAVAAPQAVQSDAVSFKASGRIANDLYEAAQSSKDPVVRRGLFEAHDNVTGMRQRYADANGFGGQFKTANQEYRNFKQNMGNGLMSDYTHAADVQDQQMLWRVSNLINPTSGEGLRAMFTSAGIDSSPINDLVKERESVAVGAKQQVKDISSRVANETDQIGTDNSIIKGESDLQFAGKNTAQIRVDALRKLVQNARKQGMGNPLNYIMGSIGMAQLAAGSIFGGFRVASSGSRIAMDGLLKNKSFQDWMIQEAGVDEKQLPMFRQSIENSGKYIRRIAQSSVLPRAIADAAQKSQPQDQPNTSSQPPSGSVSVGSMKPISDTGEGRITEIEPRALKPGEKLANPPRTKATTPAQQKPTEARKAHDKWVRGLITT